MNNKKEENVVVLDFLANGYVNSRQKFNTPIVQAIGKQNFTLLELVPKKNVILHLLETVYIGSDKRDKIHHINGKLDYEKLTSTAKSELEHAVLELVLEKEEEFVNFFNKAYPLNTRVHILELLPGVGKRHMLELVDKRKDKPFESFKDIKERVKLMPDPEKTITNRIVLELQGKEKHYLFVR